MCPGQDDTDGFCLVFADLSAQSGGIDAVLYRSVRLDTPSGNLTSSRLRCVRPASALSGTYFFPLASFLSIWHDIPESLPLPRCRWQTAYCVLLISVRFMIIISVVKSRPITGGIYLKSEGHPSAYGLFDCRTRSEAVKMP